MAVNYSDLTPGTPLVWTSSGGDYVITGTSLGDGTARQGGKNTVSIVDGTKGFPEILTVLAETKVGSAPTDGKEISIYLGWSPSTTVVTTNPGGLSGSDGSLSTPASVVPQLTFAGSIICSNAVGTGIQRQDEFVVRPKDIALIPVIFNNSGQTMSSTGTDTKITVTPWYRRTPVA